MDNTENCDNGGFDKDSFAIMRNIVGWDRGGVSNMSILICGGDIFDNFGEIAIGRGS